MSNWSGGTNSKTWKDQGNRKEKIINLSAKQSWAKSEDISNSLSGSFTNNLGKIEIFFELF